MAQQDLPLLELFSQLRECGLPLGIGEYQLALKAWQAGYGTADRAALERLCRTLWVKSPEESEIFAAQFNRLIQQGPNLQVPAESTLRRSPWFWPKAMTLAGLAGSSLIIALSLLNLRKEFNSGLGRLPLQLEVQSAILYETARPPTQAPDTYGSARPPTIAPDTAEPTLNGENQGTDIAPIMIQRPDIAPIMIVQPVPIPWWQQSWLIVWGALWLLSGAAWWGLKFWSSLAQHPGRKAQPDLALALNQHIHDEVQLARLSQAMPTGDYLPVTGRQMKQSWRYLRRMVRQGPPTDLDIEATVQAVGRQGLLLAPVFRARRVNRAEVLLLIDQDGSMVPFHGLSQRLVATALQGGRLTQASVYYFHNCPVGVLFHDPYAQSADPVDRVLQSLSSDYAGVLVVSDGGAAYGRHNPRRLALTEAFLRQAFQRVRYVAWLNPMPQERWAGTTAEAIAQQVPMFEFNRAGLEQAIGVLRGQRGQHL